MSPESPESVSSLDWKPNPSPDLGFVDYVEIPFSSCHSRLSLPAGSQVNKVKTLTESSQPDPATAAVLLSKSLKVEVEKLPSVMTSMVTSKNHPSLLFKRSEASSSRKRYTGVLGNNQRSASKKSPRFVSVDQRKSSLNKTIPGSKELLLHPNLFNSFRITKPKSNLKCDQTSRSRPNSNKKKSAGSKTAGGVNGIHFDSQSFYSDSKTGPQNKQSDLQPPLQPLPPTSATTSTVFSTSKTESKEHFSSKINFLDDKNDSENSTEGSQEAVQDIINPSQDRADKSCRSEAVTHPEEAIFALPNPKKIRFPAVPCSSAIQCKWEGCGECFKTHGKLSDHIKVTESIFLINTIRLSRAVELTSNNKSLDFFVPQYSAPVSPDCHLSSLEFFTFVFNLIINQLRRQISASCSQKLTAGSRSEKNKVLYFFYISISGRW